MSGETGEAHFAAFAETGASGSTAWRTFFDGTLLGVAAAALLGELAEALEHEQAEAA